MTISSATRAAIERWENEGGRALSPNAPTSSPMKSVPSHDAFKEMLMDTVPTFKTRIDLPADKREKLIALLNQQLADTFDLHSQAKQAHWNVKGAQFHALHDLFEKLAEELANYADTIAERATALGGLALGTVRLAAAHSRLPECDLNVADSLPTVEALAVRFAALAGSTRQAIELAEAQNDADTADLFTEVSRGLDKSLWFLEAHLQS